MDFARFFGKIGSHILGVGHDVFQGARQVVFQVGVLAAPVRAVMRVLGSAMLMAGAAVARG